MVPVSMNFSDLSLNPDFKVTPSIHPSTYLLAKCQMVDYAFNAEYLRNKTAYRHSYTMKYSSRDLRPSQGCHFEWPRMTFDLWRSFQYCWYFVCVADARSVIVAKLLPSVHIKRLDSTKENARCSNRIPQCVARPTILFLFVNIQATTFVIVPA